MRARILQWEPGVAGVDEAGRGALAGPVVVGAVLLPAGFDLTGLDDSKRLTRSRREAQAARVLAGAVSVLEFADAAEVDRLNVLHATLAAMRRAMLRLDPTPLRALVDGNRVPAGLPFPGDAVVQGDGLHAAIAAASIIAKTARDAAMREAARLYPEYHFDRNFGYGTPDHFEALREHGPCPIHRRTFYPVSDMLEQPCLDIGN